MACAGTMHNLQIDYDITGLYVCRFQLTQLVEITESGCYTEVPVPRLLTAANRGA